uniref:Uncharacterized protein n=1 Tax=Pyramimonas obovata TaxID=1411642 RepID=A0A7S0MX05_9CHLO|mmetsp:Transcript_14657/g.31420  ORF Transcript_14657/g.31420 Transcript_14657/m.31420 type:complete len:220 (+) Transcript_14657:314-973(+)|eukprot:CAMPEP_0118953986 /NCGR_PEP_ID=MMETSP1169-20130426/57514_1 /TAXON_ID=36882 /ORGANISM="Pyramimonas obovata, Strain CCMP722" /LENGTH=219 /DNA_ID=CAMNT_0006901551 /DNA_START=270 /DNA_END=929 /DNA_ORIENTATION=+
MFALNAQSMFGFGPRATAALGGWEVMDTCYTLYKEYLQVGMQTNLQSLLDKTNESARLAPTLPCVNYDQTVLIYSAKDIQRAVISSPPPSSALVQLEVWKSKGFLYFKTESLNFGFAIPVLIDDGWAGHTTSTLLNVWMLASSARWLSLVMYLGVAANHVGLRDSPDPSEMAGYVYHPSHTMVRDSDNLASIEIPGARLDYSEEFDRGEAPWYAVLIQS